MDQNTIVGCVAIFLSLAILAVLVLVSRRRIDRIGRTGFRSARHILKDFNGDR